MDYSSDEEFSDDWIPYRDRKEWQDVQPVEQDDGENPIVSIAYSAQFKDVYDYFRAVVSTGEKSQRALDLTKDAIKLNAANYTVWQYRRDIIKELGLSLLDELEYSEEIILRNPKNYQVWHHRRIIVEWLDNSSKELQITADVLELDAKNYHAWQHRQWAMKTYNLFDNELSYTDTLISNDVRNNSAWNQRYFVLENTGFTAEILQREIMFTMNRIRFVKNNESSWNYLRGLLQKGDRQMDQFPEVVQFCEELYSSGINSPYLVAFLIDVYEEKCLRSYEQARTTTTTTTTESPESDAHSNDQQLADKVYELCDLMANEYDVIREKYWHYVADHFRLKLAKVKECKNAQDEQGATSNKNGFNGNGLSRDSTSAASTEHSTSPV